jgi:hypothetical protein
MKLISTLCIYFLITQVIISQNTFTPTPVLFHGLNVSFKKGDSVTLNARVFDAGSFVYDDPNAPLYFSYEGEDSLRKFSTNLDGDRIEVKIYVIDSAGNSEYGLTFLDLSTNQETDIIGTIDTIPPTPLVYNSVPMVVPSSGIALLNANQFDRASFDNISPSSALRFTFGPDPTQIVQPLSCYNVGRNELTIYVWDEANNFAAVPTYLEISDPLDICTDSSYADHTSPFVKIKDPLEIEIQPDQLTALIYPWAYDDGSTDTGTGIRSIRYTDSTFHKQYQCGDVLTHPVDLKITDMVGNDTIIHTTVLVTDPNNYCSVGNKARLAIHPLKLFPNPASAQLTYQSDNSDGYFIIYDMQGRLVQKSEKTGSQGQMDVHSLPQGTYLLTEYGVQGVKRQLFQKL